MTELIKTKEQYIDDLEALFQDMPDDDESEDTQQLERELLDLQVRRAKILNESIAAQAEHKNLIVQAAKVDDPKKRNEITGKASSSLSHSITLQKIADTLTQEIDALSREIGNRKSQNLWPVKHLLSRFQQSKQAEVDALASQLVERLRAYEVSIGYFLKDHCLKIPFNEISRYTEIRVKALDPWT